MKVVDYKAQIRYSSEKMQKNEVISTPHLSSELYCLEAGQAEKAHKHIDADKIYFVLEGSGRFSIGRTTREIKAGMAVLAAQGEEHGVINVGDERLLMLVFTAPGGKKI